MIMCLKVRTKDKIRRCCLSHWARARLCTNFQSDSDTGNYSDGALDFSTSTFFDLFLIQVCNFNTVLISGHPFACLGNFRHTHTQESPLAQVACFLNDEERENTNFDRNQYYVLLAVFVEQKQVAHCFKRVNCTYMETKWDVKIATQLIIYLLGRYVKWDY
jgi:hypothetical protein